MAAKVYWKSLRLVIHRMIAYINKWNTQLSENLTGEQYAAVNSLASQAQDVLNDLPVDTPTT